MQSPSTTSMRRTRTHIQVKFEQDLLLAHDIIFHHPFYWYSPALKEWQDLVLGMDLPTVIMGPPWKEVPHSNYRGGEQVIVGRATTASLSENCWHHLSKRLASAGWSICRPLLYMGHISCGSNTRLPSTLRTTCDHRSAR